MKGIAVCLLGLFFCDFCPTVLLATVSCSQCVCLCVCGGGGGISIDARRDRDREYIVSSESVRSWANLYGEQAGQPITEYYSPLQPAAYCLSKWMVLRQRGGGDTVMRSKGGSRGGGATGPWPPPKTIKLLCDTASDLVGLVSSNRLPPPPNKTACWIRP